MRRQKYSFFPGKPSYQHRNDYVDVWYHDHKVHIHSPASKAAISIPYAFVAVIDVVVDRSETGFIGTDGDGTEITFTHPAKVSDDTPHLQVNLIPFGRWNTSKNMITSLTIPQPVLHQILQDARIATSVLVAPKKQDSTLEQTLTRQR